MAYAEALESIFRHRFDRHFVGGCDGIRPLGYPAVSVCGDRSARAFAYLYICETVG